MFTISAGMLNYSLVIPDTVYARMLMMYIKNTVFCLPSSFVNNSCRCIRLLQSSMDLLLFATVVVVC